MRASCLVLFSGAAVATTGACCIALWGLSLTSLDAPRCLRRRQLQCLAFADLFYGLSLFSLVLVDVSQDLFGLGSPLVCTSTYTMYLSGRAVSLLLEAHIAVGFLFQLSSAWTWTLCFPWMLGLIAGAAQTYISKPGEPRGRHCDAQQQDSVSTVLIDTVMLSVLGLNVAIYGVVILRHKFSRFSVRRFMLFLFGFLGPYCMRIVQNIFFKNKDMLPDAGAPHFAWITLGLFLELLNGACNVCIYVVSGQLVKLSFRTTIRRVEMQLWDSTCVPSTASCWYRFSRKVGRAVLLVFTAMEQCDDLEHGLRQNDCFTASVVSAPTGTCEELILSQGITFNELFRVEEILEDGSFFRVESVRARGSYLQLVCGQRYAVKVFRGRSSEQQVQRAHRERDLLKSLQHPGVANLVVAFHWVWCGEIQRVLVFNFHGGHVLGDVVAEWGSQGLPLANAVKYSAEILDALAYLHSLDFLHRDLCLTNVFLTPLYHCQLADYNLATRSTGGTARPTPQYSAPEILSGNGEYGPLADVYSFGVIVLFMFGGTHSISDKDVAHFRTHFFLDVHLPSPDIEPLLQSTMAQDPNDRHSADELRSAAFFEDVSWSKQREACWNDHAQTYQTSPMSSVA